MITHFYAYTLMLEAPLLLTALEGDPNSVRSLGFIPGSAIRGAVAGVLERAKDPQFHALILSGQVCYLNAYPTVDARRSLPIPSSFRQDKYGTAGHDLAGYSGRPDDNHAPEDVWPVKQLKGLDAPFLSLDRADLRPSITSVESRVHQQRYRPKGKSYTDPVTNEERGTIFTYEALEANQEFRGVLAVSGQNETEIDTCLQRIKSTLGEKVSLGRSRRARYGGAAHVTSWTPLGDCEAEGQTGVITKDPHVRSLGLKAGTRFRAFLTSDYIGRNSETGQIDPAWFTEEIYNRFGRSQVKGLWPRWAFRLVGGYNRTWGLQLPQVLVLRAGSILVMEAQQTIPHADLLAIEQTGLGERRTEGFGRVLFLAEGSQSISIRPVSSSFASAPTLPVPDLVNVMQQRI